MEIAIEPLLFGEYYVSVYKDKDLILDKKYYCINLDTAMITAGVLKGKYPDAILKMY